MIGLAPCMRPNCGKISYQLIRNYILKYKQLISNIINICIGADISGELKWGGEK